MNQRCGLHPEAKNSEVLLQSKVNVARVAVSEGRFQEALHASCNPCSMPKAPSPRICRCRSILQLAQAAIGLKDYARANHDLEQELTTAQRAGMRFDSGQNLLFAGNFSAVERQRRSRRRLLP